MALRERGEKIYTSQEVMKQQYGTVIKQLDKNTGELIQVFASAREAAKSLRPESPSPGVISHITDVCKGRRKTAYGYRWQYAEQLE